MRAPAERCAPSSGGNETLVALDAGGLRPLACAAGNTPEVELARRVCS